MCALVSVISILSGMCDPDKFRELLDEAGKLGSDIVCFQEGMNYVANNPWKSEPVPGPTINLVAEKAKEYGMYAIAPVLEQRDDLLYNTAVIIDRRGQIIGKYEKTHLTLGEAWGKVKVGENLPVFETDFGRIAVLICMDIHFPEIARVYALKGAQLLFFPGSCHGFSQLDYETMFRALMIDNCMYGAIANTLLPDLPPYSSSTVMRTVIVAPDGHIIAGKVAPWSVTSAKIDLDNVPVIKDGETTIGLRECLLKSRRPELYKIISQKTEMANDGLYGSDLYEQIRMRGFSTFEEAMKHLGKPVSPFLEEPNANLRDRAKVATISMPENDRTSKMALNLIDEASRCNPDIILLPEDFASTSLKPEPLSGPTITRIADEAKRYDTYIIAPIHEKTEGGVYSSAVLIDTSGKVLGVYRKTHLTLTDKKLGIKAGDSLPVFPTEFGKIGLILGFDFFFPEVVRVLTLQGARMLFWSTDAMSHWPTQYALETVLSERAVSYCTPLAVATYGNEKPYPLFKHLRRSCIIGPEGQTIVSTPGYAPGVAFAQINLSDEHKFPGYPGPFKYFLLRQTRPELYTPITDNQ